MVFFTLDFVLQYLILNKFTLKPMAQEKDIELMAYFAAINNALTERGKHVVEGDIEDGLVKAMFKSQSDYIECIDAIINLREEN